MAGKYFLVISNVLHKFKHIEIFNFRKIIPGLKIINRPSRIRIGLFHHHHFKLHTIINHLFQIDLI
jgi:hypothetical protein